MHIGEVLNTVYDEDIGWRPASGGIKPVHVANGLVRAIQGAYYDVTPLGSFVVWWKKGKVPDEHRTFESLTHGPHAKHLGSLAESSHAFERARKYALGLLGADQAVFPTLDQSSFTLTCGQMATRDSNDQGLGEFAAFILSGDESSSSLAKVIENKLSLPKPDDPITALVWPLLPEKRTEYRSKARLSKASQQAHNRYVFEALKKAAWCLATHEGTQGNRLHTLQRAVHFACVMPFVHAQALCAQGDLSSRPPALMAISGQRGSEMAIASERSLDNIFAKFEEWLGTRLAKRIRAGKFLVDDEPLAAESTDGRSIRAILRRFGVAKRDHRAPSPEELDTRYQTYVARLKELAGADPAEVLGHAIVQCYVNEYESGGPRAFLQGLGRRAGLFYPHFQGRAREKRVKPSVPVLDMLVRACVPAKSVVPLEEFLSTLWQRFGLVIGGRRSDAWDDAERLAASGIALEYDDLAVNTEALVDELALMGLARRYPDGVTFVGDGHAT